MSEPIDTKAERRICEAATPGPWTWQLQGVTDAMGPAIWAGNSSVPSTNADCAFITHIRTAYPRVLDELESTREELAEWQAMFDLHRKAEQRGIRMWQEATGRKLTWPDTASFTKWLIEQLEAAEQM